MPTAIYSFTTEEELAAHFTLHPIRGVLDNDIAIVCGGEYNDDFLVYKAVKVKPYTEISPTPSSGPALIDISTIQLGVDGEGSFGRLRINSVVIDTAPSNFDFPITALPGLVKSNDGFVQWTLLNRSYSEGGFPKNTRVPNMLPIPESDMPAKWVDVRTDKLDPANQINEFVGSKRWHWDNSIYAWWSPQRPETVWSFAIGTHIWSWDTTNQLYNQGYALPLHYYEDLGETWQSMSYSAATLCEYDQKIHWCGGPGSGTGDYTDAHSTFDTVHKQWRMESLAPLPQAARGGTLIDCSMVNGNLYYFSGGLIYSRDQVWAYNVPGNYWYVISELYPYSGVDVCGHVKDPYLTDHWLLCDNDAYGFARFNPKSNRYTPSAEHFEKVAEGDIVFSFRQAIYWDDYIGGIVIPLFDDVQVYDPVLDVVTYIYDFLDSRTDTAENIKWLGNYHPYYIDEAAMAPLLPNDGNAYQLTFSWWDYWNYVQLFAMNKDTEWEYQGHG